MHTYKYLLMQKNKKTNQITTVGIYDTFQDAKKSKPNILKQLLTKQQNIYYIEKYIVDDIIDNGAPTIL